MKYLLIIFECCIVPTNLDVYFSLFGWLDDMVAKVDHSDLLLRTTNQHMSYFSIDLSDGKVDPSRSYFWRLANSLKFDATCNFIRLSSGGLAVVWWLNSSCCFISSFLLVTAPLIFYIEIRYLL